MAEFVPDAVTPPDTAVWRSQVYLDAENTNRLLASIEALGRAAANLAIVDRRLLDSEHRDAAGLYSHVTARCGVPATRPFVRHVSEQRVRVEGNGALPFGLGRTSTEPAH